MIRLRFAFLVTLLALPLAVWGQNNPLPVPPDPNCRYGLDPANPCCKEPNSDCPRCSHYLKGAASGAPLTSANSPSSENHFNSRIGKKKPEFGCCLGKDFIDPAARCCENANPHVSSL